MHMRGRVGSRAIIEGCRCTKKCLQHRVAEQRFLALAVALLIIRQCVLLAGRRRLVRARHQPTIPDLAWERRASLMSTQLASRCLQIHVPCIGRAASSGHEHHRDRSVPWISRKRAPRGGLSAGRCASRLRITKVLALLQMHLATIPRARKTL